MDGLDEVNRLKGRKRNSGFGSKRGISRKSKADTESDTLLKRVKKDNVRLRRELEEAEAESRQLVQLREENEQLLKEITELRAKVVTKADLSAVIDVLKEERMAVAVTQLERDNVNTEILNLQKNRAGTPKTRKSG